MVKNKAFVGLFGVLGEDGKIRNLGLEEVSVAATGGIDRASNNGLFLGSLVGFNENGVITDCYATGNVTGNRKNLFNLNSVRIGGLVGANEGEISDSYTMGDVMTIGNVLIVGGLVGVNQGEISDSYTMGNVNSKGNHTIAGGLAGTSSSAITECYAMGDVQTKTTLATYASVPAGGTSGGLVGRNTRDIHASYATGSVKAIGNDAVSGGLVGEQVFSSGTAISAVSACYATGNVIAETLNPNKSDDYITTAGGLIGIAEGNDDSDFVTASYATGDVTAGGYAGGLVGTNITKITACYARGNVKLVGGHSDGRAGGLAGRNFYEVRGGLNPGTLTGIIDACYATGLVTGDVLPTV